MLVRIELFIELVRDRDNERQRYNYFYLAPQIKGSLFISVGGAARFGVYGMDYGGTNNRGN